jgi:quinohemoprotein ethanol dehydrogenase
MRIRLAAVAAIVAACASVAIAQPATNPGANVDGTAIINADKTPGEWLSNGRTYSEQRFSPLASINTSNVKNLGVAWEYRTYSVRGLEATPIVVDGVIYITESWSKVAALDAKTGKELWQFDPKVPGGQGRYACCDVVNRGVALWKGAVFVGTLDGRLIKLDAKTGKVLWSVDTVENHSHTYTITGAPRAFDGLIVIGNGGAEYDSRGYVTAYDAVSGKQVWRFHVVPGDPSKPQENAALTAALRRGTQWANTGSGKSAVAAHRGTPLPTIRSLILFISAPATAIRGTAKCVRQKAATISICHRSSRCMRRADSSHGPIKRRRAIRGTSIQPRTSSLPI